MPSNHEKLQWSASNFPQATSFGDVQVDFSRMEFTRKGCEVGLTALEYKILGLLLRNPRRVIPRKEFFEVIWDDQVCTEKRTLDVHICKLRQKLENDPSNPIHLRTVQRVGYKFVP